MCIRDSYAIVLLFPLFGLWNFFLWLDARELWKKLLSPIPLLLPQLLALIVVIGVFWIDKQVSYFHFFRAFEFVTGKLQ